MVKSSFLIKIINWYSSVYAWGRLYYMPPQCNQLQCTRMLLFEALPWKPICIVLFYMPPHAFFLTIDIYLINLTACPTSINSGWKFLDRSCWQGSIPEKPIAGFRIGSNDTDGSVTGQKPDHNIIRLFWSSVIIHVPKIFLQIIFHYNWTKFPSVLNYFIFAWFWF